MNQPAYGKLLCGILRIKLVASVASSSTSVPPLLGSAEILFSLMLALPGLLKISPRGLDLTLQLLSGSGLLCVITLSFHSSQASSRCTCLHLEISQFRSNE